ncbi:MAG: hypothetical protein K6B42_09675, partial [Clostridia bacterium]|nr:hypothetical protein [Clostridia bacterium]
MRKGNIFRRFTAAVLVIVMLFSCNAVRVLADTIEENQTLDQTYIKEVKMFYGRTEEAARKSCEAEGFTFCPENLMEETNSVLVAHLGYKTTDDPGDAITDLSLLDMKNSHYTELVSYEEYLDEHISEYSDTADQVMHMVNEYRTNVHAGSPLALASLDSLNNFCVDKDAAPEGNNLLGNYLLNKADVTFFEKYIQRGSSMIFGEIASLLATATASYNADGSNWATKANTNEAYDSYVNGDSATRNQLNGWHQDIALVMIEKIKELAEVYNEAKPLYDQYGNTFGFAETMEISENFTVYDILEANPDCKIVEYTNAILTYELFDSFVFREANQTVVTNTALLYDGKEAVANSTVVYTERKTLAEYFMELAADPDIPLHPEILYPFVASMTDGQKAALKLCGLESLARGLKQPENYGAERAQLTAEATQKLKDLGCENGKIWIWDGVDLSIYSKKTVETSEAIEKANSGKELKDSENQAARDAASNRRMILAVADIAIMVVSGTAMILQGVVGGSLWAAGVYVLSYLCIANVLGTVVFTLVGTFLIGFFFASAVAFILSVGYMIYMLLDLAGVFDDYNLVDYETIPDIVYHVRGSGDAEYRVRYDAVASNANRESVYADYEVEFRPVAVGTKEEILDLRLLTLFES